MKIDLALHHRDNYSMQLQIPTRWNDYDLLGHVNNVLYNRYIEITVLELVKRAGLDWRTDTVIPYAAETNCRFLKPLLFSETIDAALRVSHLGRSSAVYEVALYMPDRAEPGALGRFVHVFVDRTTEQNVPIPDAVRAYYEKHLFPSQP